MNVIKGLLIGLFLFTWILGRGQVSEGFKKDLSNHQSVHYILIEKKLPVLKVDSCLLAILTIISDRDVHCSYFNKGKSCFRLSSHIEKGYLLLNITPTYLDILSPIDYFGIIEVNNLKFICYGDDDLNFFHKTTKDSITIKYRKPLLKTEKDTLAYEKENLMLLCEGCLSTWSFMCKDYLINIYALICDTPVPNLPLNQINKSKKN